MGLSLNLPMYFPLYMLLGSSRNSLVKLPPRSYYWVKLFQKESERIKTERYNWWDRKAKGRNNEIEKDERGFCGCWEIRVEW